MLLNNHPTFHYISWKGLVIVDSDDVPYVIYDDHSMKKYIYWELDNPYVLVESNERLRTSLTRYLIYINDYGDATEVPHEDIFLRYKDTGNGNGITSELLGKFDDINNSFVTVSKDITGIKEVLGSSESGDGNSVIDRLTKVEKTSEGITETITSMTTDYNEDKEMQGLRDSVNVSLIGINGAIALYEEQLTSYCKDMKISTEEKGDITKLQNNVNTELGKLYKVHDEIIKHFEELKDTQSISLLNKAKTNLTNAINSLNQNINTCISDNTIIPSEITIMLNMFANASVKINEYKNTMSDIIILGIGGVITSQIAEIKKRSNEILLSVTEQIKEINTEANGSQLLKNTTYSTVNKEGRPDGWTISHSDLFTIDNTHNYEGNASMKILQYSANGEIYMRTHRDYLYNRSDAILSAGVQIYIASSPKMTSYVALTIEGYDSTFHIIESKRIEAVSSKKEEWQKLVLEGVDFTSAVTKVGIKIQMNNVGCVYVNSAKLEKGDKCTDWSESIEGIKAELKSFIDIKIGEITTEVSKKVNGNEIIASINLSVNGEESKAKINADRVDINGLVTFINNSNSSTQIDGDKIKTGSIDADKINTKLFVVKDGNRETLRINNGKITIDADDIKIQSKSFSIAVASEANKQIGIYMDSDRITTLLSKTYATKEYIDDKGYVTAGTVAQTLKNEITLDKLTTTLGEHYTTTSDVEGVLEKGKYQTKTDIDTLFTQEKTRESIKTLLSKTYTTTGEVKDLLTTGKYQTESTLTTYMSQEATINALVNKLGSSFTSESDVEGILATKKYATETSIKTTLKEWTATFSESGGYNLLTNSAFTNEMTDWIITSYNSPSYIYNSILQSSYEWAFPNNQANTLQLRMGTGSNKEYGVTQKLNTTIGKNYTVSFHFAGHRVSKANTIIRKAQGGSWLANKSFKPSDFYGSNSSVSKWGKFTFTFTATQTTHWLNIVMDEVSSDGYMWIAEPMVEEGSLNSPYSPHPSEVYTGITKIDKNGITVSQSNIGGEAKMNANGFYLTKGKENIFKVDKDGAYFKGKVEISSGTVPDSALSSTAQTGIKNGGNAMSVLNQNKNSWDKASTSIKNWSYSDTTLIDGGKIKTGTLTAGHITSDMLNSRTITGVEIRGKGSFYTAPLIGETGDYQFRIGADGNVWSKRQIQVYGTAGDNVYTEIKDGVVLSTEKIQVFGTPQDGIHSTLYNGYVYATYGIQTGAKKISIGIRGTSVGVGSIQTQNRLEFVYVDSEGETFFRPSRSAGCYLGGQTYPWAKLYSKYGMTTTSDRNLKENVKYIDTPTLTRTALPQMYDFISKDYVLTEYNYKDGTELRISAIAQDLLLDDEQNDNIIGQLIVNNEEVLRSRKNGEEAYLSIDQTQLLNVTIGALQEAMKKIEILEQKVEELENK